jgi:hypothetical protein
MRQKAQLLDPRTSLYSGGVSMVRSAADDIVYEIEAPDREKVEGTYAIVPVTEAESWEKPEPSGTVTRPERVPACRDAAVTILIEQPRLGMLGRGAERELHRRVERAMEWASHHHQEERGPFEGFAQAVGRVAVRRFFENFSGQRLDEELIDQVMRDRAVKSDAALLEYLDYVRLSLEYAQYRSRFRASDGEKAQDLISDTQTRIIEIVRTGVRPFPFAKFERAGTPSFLILYDDVRATERRHRRLTLVGTSASLPVQRTPSPEDEYLEREALRELHRFPERLRVRLSRRQREWLEALRNAAEEEGGGRGILSRAAYALGVDKSQATRAIERIAAVGRRYRIVEEILD